MYWLVIADVLSIQSSLSIRRGLVLGLPQVPKSEDAQVSYVKCHRTMPMVGPPHLQTPNREMKIRILFLICGWLKLQTQNPWRRRADSTLSIILTTTLQSWTYFPF